MTESIIKESTFPPFMQSWFFNIFDIYITSASSMLIINYAQSNDSIGFQADFASCTAIFVELVFTQPFLMRQ